MTLKVNFIGYSKTLVVQNYTALQKLNVGAGFCDSEKSFILHHVRKKHAQGKKGKAQTDTDIRNNPGTAS